MWLCRAAFGPGQAGPGAGAGRSSVVIRDDITVRLAGESGEGVISGGDILTTGAARTGYWALTFRTYPAEIKGGPCMYQVRVGVDEVHSQGNAVDLLMCFNQEAFDLHHHELAADGHIVCDAESVKVTPEFESRSSEVAARRRSRRRRAAAGAARTWSRSGSSAGCSGSTRARIEEMILKRYAHKGDVGEANIRSLLAGAEHARDDASRRRASPRPAGRRATPSACCSPATRRSASARCTPGLTYYAGYPITPASDILEWLAGAAAALRRRRDPDRGRDRRAGLGAGRVVRRAGRR